MSTRATVHFRENGETVAIVYRHHDGYQDGLGQDLKEFIKETYAEVTEDGWITAGGLAARWIVWDARLWSDPNDFDFMGIAILAEDPGDIEFRYLVEVDDPGARPKIVVEPLR